MNQSEQLWDRGASISKRSEYVANAKECARLGETAGDPDERTVWLQMARQWLRWATLYTTSLRPLASPLPRGHRCGLADGASLRQSGVKP
jgi:hypothetical protein